MKTIWMLIFTVISSTLNATVLPDVTAKLKNIEVLKSEENEIRFKASGKVRMFVRVPEGNTEKHKWEIQGRPAQLVSLVIQDGIFHVTRGTNKEEVWQKNLKKLTETATISIRLQKAKVTIGQQLASMVKAKGM